MAPPASTELLAAWERQAGEAFAAHFTKAWSYLGQTVGELASDEAEWTITTLADHAVLVLASETAFAIVAFSSSTDPVTVNGALHPLREGMVRVSFNDRLADDEVDIDGIRRFKPMIRQWTFDWHGRLQLPIEYWLPLSPPAPDDSPIQITLRDHERQRGMAHHLARAAFGRCRRRTLRTKRASAGSRLGLPRPRRACWCRPRERRPSPTVSVRPRPVPELVPPRRSQRREDSRSCSLRRCCP